MPSDGHRLEEGSEILLDFHKLATVSRSAEPVLPVAVQDVDSNQVLMVAYANEQALQHSLEHGIAAFWSTSRNELWIKGATSGDTLQVVEIRINCEQNSLLYRVRLLGSGVCHTHDADGVSRRTCYYRRIVDGHLEFVPDSKGLGNP
jgi:phosphoribosyl-AMP cyclohydrolase